MAEKWSDQQREAIDTSGCDLLVSASAGSGKTSVLAARIGKFVKEGKKLGRLLVVTFTKLAAAEMKQRIAKTLRDLAAAHPENTNLRTESLKLYKANISTIDSFGIDLLRRNFHVAGISPDFSVLDENEVVIVKEGVMRSLMEAYYRTFPTGFSEYLDLFGENSDSRKAEKMIQDLAAYTETVPFPDRWLRRQETEFCDADSVAKTICALTLPYAEEYCRILEIAKAEPYEDKYIPFLLQDLDLMRSLRNLLSAGDWDGACAFVQANPLAETANRPKGVYSAGMTLYSEYHNEYKKLWNSELFALTAADLTQDLAKMREGLRFLYRAVADFRNGVRKEMARRNGYSFAVISELALELVVSDYDYVTKNFIPSPTALRERERYDEVLIDEYQDVNDMQDLFFRAITDNNCFAVGDVKQSIYGFRGSNPGNFLRKKETCKTIPMNWNFRSRGGILDYVNFLFRGLFSVEVGGMVYDHDEAFVPKRDADGANPYPQNYAETLPPSRLDEAPPAQEKDSEPHAELLLIPVPAAKSRGADEIGNAEGEARLCAKLICDAMSDRHALVYDKEAKHERKLKYSDIYILMRTTKAVSTFEKVFREANIPLLSVDGGTFLGTPEVGGILSFLQTINDPWDDLPLFVTLTGSVFAFTPEEISMLKDPGKRRPLWDGVLVAAETDPRWQAVVNTVEKYRILAENVSVARLVWTVYTATDFLALESVADPNARRNLMKFYSFARSYTRADGLFGFLEHAERARASENVKQNDAAPEGEFVRIMTIHKSKGLEAPWCIIPEIGRGFKNDTDPVSFDPEYGAAMKVRNDEGTASYNTLLLETVKRRKKRKEVAERLRVLYVALTRARDRLTMIGCCSMDLADLNKHAVHTEGGKVRLSTLLQNNNYRNTLLDRTILHPRATAIHSAFVAPESCPAEDLRVAFVGIPETVAETGGGETAVSCGLSQEELQKRFSFCYDSHLSAVPAKVSVTEIAKDPPPPDAALLLREQPLSKPQFLNENALSATELGTALHTYCQFADFDRSVEEEQDRLMAEGHLTPEAVEAMDGEQLLAFLESPLMDRLRCCKGYRREVRFVCRIPVSYYTGNPGDEGEMLMQGAMDLLYETEDGYVIVDFKSDRTTEEELLNRYSRQLNLYAAAVRRLYDKPVLGCKIWSFYLKKEISVKEEML